GLDFKYAPTVPEFVCAKFVFKRGPRSNQRHIAPKDVPKLWQFIHAGFPNESADCRHTRILLDFENEFFSARGFAVDLSCDELLNILLMNFVIAVCVHGTELQHGKSLAMLAESLLFEEDRSL